MRPTVVIEPTWKHLGSVIWLHGLGASSDDFSPVAPHMQLPDVRWIFPNAPVRPVTINGGFEMPAWFDIRTLEPSVHREPLSHVEESAAYIRTLIDAEQERGIPPERIVLMGFSQGAAMVLYVAHCHAHRLMGAVVMSGYLLASQVFSASFNPASKMTPFLFCHGIRDMVVQYRRGEEAHAATLSQHATVDFLDYPVGHEVCMEELRDVRNWLHKRFAWAREVESGRAHGPKDVS